MHGFQIFSILIVFNLTLEKIHGSSKAENGNIYNQIDNDISNYLERQTSTSSMTSQDLYKMFANYYREGKFDWPELQHTMTAKDSWNNFCIVMWNHLKGNKEPQLLQHCDHSTYVKMNSGASYPIIIPQKTGKDLRLKVDLLICYCEYRITSQKRSTTHAPDKFYVARGSETEFFILQQSNDSIQSRRLDLIDYWYYNWQQ